MKRNYGTKKLPRMDIRSGERGLWSAESQCETADCSQQNESVIDNVPEKYILTVVHICPQTNRKLSCLQAIFFSEAVWKRIIF